LLAGFSGDLVLVDSFDDLLAGQGDGDADHDDGDLGDELSEAMDWLRLVNVHLNPTLK
jgi:hypothetical protein